FDMIVANYILDIGNLNAQTSSLHDTNILTAPGNENKLYSLRISTSSDQRIVSGLIYRHLRCRLLFRPPKTYSSLLMFIRTYPHPAASFWSCWTNSVKPADPVAVTCNRSGFPAANPKKAQLVSVLSSRTSS